MEKAYNRINWQNQPNTSTALGATNLNKMDNAINTIDDRVITLDLTKASSEAINTMVKDVVLNPTDGVITVTYQNGTVLTYDTKLEKLAVNFGYDADTEQLVITLDDGTAQYIDLSSLITQYEFENSSTVGFTVADGKVKAEIPNGGVTPEKLQADYLANITVQAQTATQQASLSKRYAVGGIEEGDTTDNAKYYRDQAKQYRDEAQGIVNIDIATDEIAGIVKGGGNVTINPDGTMSVTLPEITAPDIIFDPTGTDMEAVDLDGAIRELKELADQAFTGADNLKNLWEDAIIGLDPSIVIPEDATGQQLHDLTLTVETGTDTSDATITPSKVLAGYRGYGAEGVVDGNIPSKAAATYQPSNVEQTIAANQFLAGDQTIAPVTGTATPADVATGKTFRSAASPNLQTGTASGGKKTASGTVTASISQSGFRFLDNRETYSYYIAVTGLDFIPSVINCWALNSGNYNNIMYNSNLNQYETISSFVVNSSDSGSFLKHFKMGLDTAYKDNTGFCIPAHYSNILYKWWASE